MLQTDIWQKTVVNDIWSMYNTFKYFLPGPSPPSPFTAEDWQLGNHQQQHSRETGVTRKTTTTLYFIATTTVDKRVLVHWK
jgi:hypothetical protein